MIVWFQDFWIIPVVLGFNRNQLELSFVCFLKPDAEPDLWWVLAVGLLVRWADNVKTVDT